MTANATPDEAILVTGGSGLLGGALRQLMPAARFPSSGEFNVLDREQMRNYVAADPPATLLHAAAKTSPPDIEREPVAALEANIVGTANVVRLCQELDCRLVYVSTDYVFPGDTGGYREEDPVRPVNKYAWSKLGGECAVRLWDKSLIVRTTFGPDVFPYPKAFVDQWTSREPVSAIARKIALLARRPEVTGTIHVGGPRRTVFEYARSLDPDQEIGELSADDVGFPVPRDTSLECERFERLFAGHAEEEA